MQSICKANNDVLVLWNEGKVKPGTYRLLTYLLSETVEEGTLLHNAVTGEMVLLDDAEMQNLALLPCAYAPWMDALIEKHFLVRDELDDKKTVDMLRMAWNIADNPREIISYTILPTTHCNARCFYCYEAGCQHENMSDETADKLVDFIASHRGDKKVHIGWFGGEPLVGIHRIDRITNALTEREIPFSSSMISNGFLFNEEIAKRAREQWNLKRIQITLDGTENVYNEIKAYVTPCESPFQKVLDNIEYLLKQDIRVSVRINLGFHNADDLNALVDQLAERFEEKKNLIVYSHLLFDDCGFQPKRFSDEEYATLNEMKERLDARIRAFSFASPKEKLPHLKKNRCMADNTQSVIVLPTGKLGKCDFILDRLFVGSLEQGIHNTQELKLFQERVVFPACATCPLYPGCIKLKRCEPERDCAQAAMKTKLEESKRVMRFVYEEYLRKEENTAEPQEDCRKGGTV